MSAQVYRIYDPTDRLIYVGATTNLDQRINCHRTQAWWYRLAHRLEVEPHGSVAEAFAAEKQAIHSERPAFNGKGCGNPTKRLTADDVRVCREWHKSKKRGGLLPVALRWVTYEPLTSTA